MSNDIEKADQLAFHFYTKFFFVLHDARATVGASPKAKTDKWFNLSIPDCDLFTKDVREPYRAISLAPTPGPLLLEIQVLLVVPELANDQILVYDVTDTHRVKVEPMQRFILLEAWSLEMDFHNRLASGGHLGAEGVDVAIPTTYKHGIVLFRSLFSLLRVLPAWKLYKRLKRSVNRNGNLSIQLRVCHQGEKADDERDILKFGVPPTPSQRPVPTKTHTFPPVPHLLGTFTLRTIYLTTPHFSLLHEREMVLSSEFLLFDEYLSSECQQDEGFYPTLKHRRQLEWIFGSGAVAASGAPVARNPGGAGVNEQKQHRVGTDSHDYPENDTSSSSGSFSPNITVSYNQQNRSAYAVSSSPGLSAPIPIPIPIRAGGPYFKADDSFSPYPKLTDSPFQRLAYLVNTDSALPIGPYVVYDQSLDNDIVHLDEQMSLLASPSPPKAASADSLPLFEADIPSVLKDSAAESRPNPLLPISTPIPLPSPRQVVSSPPERDIGNNLQAFDPRSLDLTKESTESFLISPTVPTSQPEVNPFAYAQLHDLSGKVTKECPVGGGSFSDVYMGYWVTDTAQTKVAIKELRSHIYGQANIEKLDKRLRRELRIWGNLNHPKIVSLFGVTSDFGKTTAMVCRWMSQGTLSDYLEKENLYPQRRLNICIDIADGLSYLHSQKVIHGDLTPANVLMDNDTAHLSDFGLSNVIDELQGPSFFTSKVGGSARWIAPELLRDATLAMSSDVYSFASVAFYAITGMHPYAHLRSEHAIVAEIFKSDHKFPSRREQALLLTDECWNIFTMCWATDPAERPCIKDVKHRLQQLVFL